MCDFFAAFVNVVERENTARHQVVIPELHDELFVLVDVGELVDLMKHVLPDPAELFLRIVFGINVELARANRHVGVSMKV